MSCSQTAQKVALLHLPCSDQVATAESNLLLCDTAAIGVPETRRCQSHAPTLCGVDMKAGVLALGVAPAPVADPELEALLDPAGGNERKATICDA